MSPAPIFFYLDPLDKAAAQIVSLTENAPFKLRGKVCFRIGVGHDSKNPGQLVSFGSDPACCDIILPQGYSQKQCHFFIHPRTEELLLRDDTTRGSTSLSSLDDPSDLMAGLPNSQPRQRVVVNTEPEFLFKMGQASFMLMWINRPAALEAAKTKSMITRSVARISSQYLLPENGKIVHKPIRELGRGANATVFKTLNLRTGSHLAVKKFPPIPGISRREESNLKEEYKREVRLVSQLSHPNIAVFLHAQGWEPNEDVEIFMEVYQCSLTILLKKWIKSKGPARQPPFFSNLVKQMLGALIYLQQKKILHRDVKPDNILSDGANNFYLADFGLAKTENMSNSYVGSLEFTAPDIFRAGLQTTKVDVWSLGVVILEVLHLLPQCPFDTWDKMCKGDQAWFHIVTECAKERVPQIMPMLQIDHRRRCSAKHCLENIFNQDSKILDMPMKPPGLSPFANQASHTQARATKQGTAHVTSSAEPEMSHQRRQSQRQGDQLGHETLGKQSAPSQTGSMTSAHLAKVTEGRRASQQGQKQTQPQAQQQGQPQAGKWVQKQAQPQTSQQAARQCDQHVREAPARQTQGPPPHPATSGLGLEEIRQIGEAHQRSCQRAKEQALEQAGKDPPLQSPLSGSEGLAEIQALGRAHRLANERAARRAIQQREHQEAQRRAPQPREHHVRGMSGRQQTGQQRDQLLRGTERREEAQRQRAQASRGDPTLRSPKSAANTKASNVRKFQTQPQRRQDERPRCISAGPKTPPLKPAAATPPKSSKAHPTSSADPPASLERLQSELQIEQDWVQSLREPSVRQRPVRPTSSADPPPASQETLQSELQTEQDWQDSLRETAVPEKPSPQRRRQRHTAQPRSPQGVVRPRWLI